MKHDGPIIAAIDFGAQSGLVLERAHAVAASQACELRVVHVHTKLLDRTELSSIGRRWIAGLGSTLESSIVLDLVEALESSVADALVSITEQRDASLIVVAAAPEHLGEVPVQLIRQAACSVLVARPLSPAGPVVAATDFSDPDVPALVAAATTARRLGVGLSAIHVVEPWAPTSIARASAVAPIVATPADQHVIHAAQRLTRTLAEIGASGNSHVMTGLPVDEVLRHASAVDARLVVVGTAGGASAVRLVIGSVAEQVAMRAPCSVLVTRLARRETAPVSTNSARSLAGLHVRGAGGYALGVVEDVEVDPTTWRVFALAARVDAANVESLGLARPRWSRARLSIPVEQVVEATEVISVRITLDELVLLLASATIVSGESDGI